MNEAQRLFASGYRCMSNRHCMVGRIDRADWREHMASERCRGFPGDPQKNFDDAMRWVTGLGEGAADYYRRVHSRDRLEISQGVYNEIKKASPGAGWGGCNEYLEIVAC